jgi:hypothetical protein
MVGFVLGNSDANRNLTVAEAQFLLGLQYYAIATPINFGAVGDTAIPIPLPSGFSNYVVDSAWIVNANGTLTSAKVGLFTQSGGGGTAIIAGGTAVTVSSGSPNTAGNIQQILPTTGATESFNAPTLYFRVTTAQANPLPAIGTVVLFVRALF